MGRKEDSNMKQTNIICGAVGGLLGLTGTALSVNDVQAIVSIVCTILGFLIMVLIPRIAALVSKIKKAKEDGKITQEELDDIVQDGKEIVDQTTDFVEGITKKGEKSNDQNKD